MDSCCPASLCVARSAGMAISRSQSTPRQWHASAANDNFTDGGHATERMDNRNADAGDIPNGLPPTSTATGYRSGPFRAAPISTTRRRAHFSETVTNLPDGDQIWVRLSSHFSDTDTWAFRDLPFWAPRIYGGTAALTGPACGATLTDPTTFTWTSSLRRSSS